MPNAQVGNGLLDYVGMQYEGGNGGGAGGNAPMSDAGGLSAGQNDPGLGEPHQSIGNLLKSFLPGAALSALAGSIGGDNESWGSGLGHFAQGFLDKKLEHATEARKRKLGQEDFFIKEAYKTVQDLAGADLTGINVPQHVKQSLADLHRKANEALLNDGVISPKEASTLLALAHPIQQALAEAKTEQGSPEAKARDVERAKFATQQMIAQQEPKLPLDQTNEGDVLRGTSPEQDTARAAQRYGEAAESERSKVWPGLEEYGPLNAKSALALRERKITAAASLQRTQAAAESRNKDRIMSDAHFRARLGQTNDSHKTAVALALIKTATMQAVQELGQGVGGRDARSQDAVDTRVDEIINEHLAGLGSGMPATPKPKGGKTAGGVSFSFDTP